MSSLHNIALAYQSSDSDEEEKELDNNITEDQQTVSIVKTQEEEKELDNNKTEEQKTVPIVKTQEEEKELDNNKTEDQQTVPIVKTQDSTVQQYRTITEKVASSSEETDSEDESSRRRTKSTSNTSDSSNSDSDSVENINNNNTSNKEKKENTTNIKKKTKQIQSELDDLPPIEDLKINVPEIFCKKLGKIEKQVEQLIIIKPYPDLPTLNLDTILFINKGEKALGKIFDVFGSVSEPNYCVRFNSLEHIKESNINVGMEVYYCPDTEYTSFVFLQDLVNLKGCDAVGEDEPPEFSDDEEEHAYYQNEKKKDKDNSDNSALQEQQLMPCPQDRQRTNWQPNYSWRGNTQRYNRGRQQIRRYGFQPTNRPHFSDNFCPQYSYQSNMRWPVNSQNMHPMSSGLYGMDAAYGAPFSGSHFPQYNNYNLNFGDTNQFQGAQPSFQSNEVFQYPRIPFNVPASFNYASTSYSEHLNVPVSYTDINSYQNSYAGSSINTFWQSSPQYLNPTDANTVNQNPSQSQ